MSLLSFPSSPLNGEIYPVNPPAGINVYQWSSAEQTWRLLGSSTGVTSGTYGTPVTVPRITIDATGKITFAQDIGIQLASTSQVGLVQLTDNTISNDDATALTAAQGYKLQNEIGDISSLTPPKPNLVDAINAVNDPTGVVAGTYGNGTNVGRFTVNSLGRITFATNVPLAVATTLAPGVVRVGSNLNVTGTGLLSVPNATTSVAGAVQLVNDTTTNDNTKALTASAGYSLQLQIDALDLKNNLTFAGTINGSTGLMAQVTPEGASVGFVVGSILPFPSSLNRDFFVVVSEPGTFVPPGGSAQLCRDGDWFVSSGTQWVYYNVGPEVSVPNLQTVTDSGSTTTRSITVGGIQSNGNSTLGSNSSNFLEIKSRVASSVIPLGNEVYDLGSPTNRWRDLYVSSDSIYMGPNVITIVGGQLLINGSPLPGSGTVTAVDTGTGLTGGPIFTNGTISLADTAVTAGSYTNANITVDAQGRITAASDGFISPGTVTSIDTGTGLTGGPIVSSGIIDVDLPFFDSRYLSSKSPSVTGMDSLGFAPNALSFGENNLIKFDSDSSNSNFIGLKGPSNIPTSTTYVLPVDGSPGEVLTTDGAGTLSWGPGGGGGGGGTVTSIITDGGITGGPITSTGTISLANTGVATGSYTYASITVDEKGRITLASSGIAPNSSVTGPITNTGTAVAPVIGIQNATTGQLGAVRIGTNIDVAAGVISVKSSSTTQSGIVQLNNTVASTSVTEALTAAQGKALQDQITSLGVASNLTLAGTFDATNSQMLTVTSDGSAKSFTIGNNLPAAAAGNLDYFVIVTTTGNYNPPGGGGPYNASQGDWFLSNGTSWQYLNVGSDLPSASTGTAGIVELADVTETRTGTSTTLAITPAGAAATYLPISGFTAKGTILSASGANTPLALPVGGDNQILTACGAAPTGLCWVTPPTPVAAIPCSVLTAKGSIVAASGANTPAQVVVGVDGQVLVACSAAATGVCWQTPAVVPNASSGVFGLVKGCTNATNTALGCNALQAGGGFNNVALGLDAQLVSTSSDNISIGAATLKANTAGFQNVAIGHISMCSLTGASANQNVALGSSTLCAFTSGLSNDAVGALSLIRFETGCYNVSVGGYSSFNYVTGNFSTAVGHRALNCATGCCNTVLGAFAGENITTGCGNVALGPFTHVSDPTANNQLAIGYAAGCNWLTGDCNRNIYTTNSFVIPRATVACPATTYNNGDSGFYADGTFGAFLRMGSTFTGGDKAFIQFFFNNNIIGRINSSGTTGTQYLTTSDYRLKENVKDLEGATEVLRALPVREYNFIAEPEVTRQGFLAHELQEFVPQAVSGEKDKVDEEGNPDYQGVDASQLVPLLTAALKESIARIDALEKKVAELGG